jgi:outer membrane receptor protein involved in Fe transport
MLPFPLLARSLLFALCAIPVAAQVAPAPTPADPPPDDPEVEQRVLLDPVTFTGSNIRRFDAEKTLPITLFDRAAIEIRDAGQPSDLLQALPQITGLPLNETATLGATARGDNAAISLRGIASGNALVLLNGRRVVPHPISAAEGGVPTLSANINHLPNRGLDRIEILRDGASSIYGSDAVAGVVNFTTRRRYTGTEIATRVGRTRYDDGQEWRATLTHGLTFAQNRGRALLTADFYHRAAMFARDRAFAAEADMSARAPAPWSDPAAAAGTAGGFNFRSTTGRFGSYQLGTITSLDSFGTVNGFANARPAGVPATLVAATGEFYLQPTAAGGTALSANAPGRAGVGREFFWNNNAHRILQPRSDRTNVFASAEFDVTPRFSLFAEGGLYRAESVTYRESDGITQGTDGYLIVPASNPWNPFGTRFWSVAGTPNLDGTPRLAGTPSAVAILDKRLDDLPARVAWVDTAVYRGLAGARGKIGQTWTWEIGLLYSASRVTDNESGPSRRSLLATALNQTDATRAFNPFGRTFAVQGGALVVTGNYRNPDPVTSAFRSSYVRHGITRLGSVDVRAAGELATLGADRHVRGALGGEFRFEAYDDFRPPYAGLNPASSKLDPATNDFLDFPATADTHGSRHVAAGYAELVFPAIVPAQKLAAAESLELFASARAERYSDFGRQTKPKFGLSWRPAHGLLVRASHNRGFRAPNLAQLHSGTAIRTVTESTDTYRNGVTGLLTDGATSRRSIVSGNRNLAPETSTGKSLGVVLEIPRVPGLTLSIDYWEIRHRNVISASGTIADDTAALIKATQAELAAGKRLDQIDLGSGGPHYRGNPAIVRLPDTFADRDAFAAYNARQSNRANQRASVGAIDYIDSTYFNKSVQFLNGCDFDLNYRLPPLSIGQFTVSAGWTYLEDFHAYTARGAPRTEYRNGNGEAVGGATPPWRGTTSLVWRHKQWAAGFAHYYVGSYTDVNATTTAATWESLGRPSYIKPVWTDGAWSYRYVVHGSHSSNVFVGHRFVAKSRWFNGASLRVGVNNLFDAKPPLAADSRGYEAGLYNVVARGRSYSLQVTKKL